MMKLHQIPRIPAVSSTMKMELSPRAAPNNSQGISSSKQCDRTVMSELLDRRWALVRPDTPIHQVRLSGVLQRNGEGPSDKILFSNDTRPSLGDAVKERRDMSFYVVRDDLLHHLVNGNKARKLDGLLPLVEDHLVTDVVTCGGCQSAHAAAVAVSCAERGLRSHLLLRGEQPDVPTGYNLITTMYGHVTYVPRSLYAKREEMLLTHAELVAGSSGSTIWFSDILDESFATQKPNEVHSVRSGFTTPPLAGTYPTKVAIVNEGAGDFAGLLGIIRLVEYLSQSHIFGKEQPLKIVIDSGTGTTAVGFGLGAVCFGLPWEVTGVMLADTIERYKKQEKRLISDFKRFCGSQKLDNTLNGVPEDIVHWVEWINPRKFGNVLKGELETCQQIAQQTGILVDPIYTLAAWEQAAHLCQVQADEDAKVVMLHTGGTLGMFGLAQRYKSFFHTLNDAKPISLHNR